jgi:hypothetical protein
MNEDKLFVLTDSDSNLSVGNKFINKVPAQIGHCEIMPDVYFHLTKMPNRFHMFMMRFLLGWKFVEYTSEEPSEKILLNG